MARRNARREQALQEAKARERAAMKKIGRIEAAGVNVARSAFDPRVGAKRLDAMSTRELRRHTQRVEQFVSRQTQFVGGFAGTPIPRATWNEYQRLEKINNEHAAKVLGTYGDVRLPGQEQTIAGREEMIRPQRSERGRARNEGRVFTHIERPLSTMVSAEGLQDLVDLYRKKARGDYRQNTVEKRVNSGEAVLKYSGNADLIDAVRDLTLEQKQLLIDNSTFFDIALEQFDSPDKSEVSQVMDADYEEHEGVGKNIHVREQLEEQLRWILEIAPKSPRDERGRFMRREAYIRQLIERQNEQR